MKLLPRGAAAVLAAVLAAPLALVASPVTAAEEPSVLIVLDVSGSMARTDASGTTLLDGAKQAVAQVLSDIPAGTRVGLRAYGHTYPGDDKATGCGDTALLAPVAPVDAAAINAAVAGLAPTGFTPIGFALEQAVTDLPADGPRTIVLVSDGEDTCTPPEPCDVARRLVAEGVDVKVESVGLLLENQTARDQLSCVAEATGGSYTDVSDAQGLAASLVTLSARSARVASTSGTPVEGGPIREEAPTIKPGRWSDTALTGETLYYKFQAPEGARIVVRGTSPAVPAQAENNRLFLLDLEGDLDGGGSRGSYTSENGDTPLSTSSVVEVNGDPGTWFVKVEMARDDDQGREWPFFFDLEVTGGAASASPSPTAEPSPTDASSTPADVTSTPVAAPADPAEPATRTPGWVLPVLLVLVALVIALIVAFVLSRRPSQWPTDEAPPTQ